MTAKRNPPPGLKPLTLVGELSLADLQAIASGLRLKALTDMDFFETLASHRCILVPPWVIRVRPNGGMERVAMMTYDPEMNLDKPRTLLAVLEAMGVTKRRSGPKSGPRPVRRSRVQPPNPVEAEAPLPRRDEPLPGERLPRERSSADRSWLPNAK